MRFPGFPCGHRHRILDIRSSLHIRLIKIKILNVWQKTDVFRGTNIARTRAERTISILANRRNVHLNAGHAEIFLGKPGEGREIEILTIGERNEVVVLEVRTKFLRVESARELKSAQFRDDGAMNDFNNIRLVAIVQHTMAVPGPGFGHRDLAIFLFVAVHDVWEIEIDFVARTVSDQRNAISIPNLTAHARHSHRDLRAASNSVTIVVGQYHLNIPKAYADQTHAEKYHSREKEDSEIQAGRVLRSDRGAGLCTLPLGRVDFALCAYFSKLVRRIASRNGPDESIADGPSPMRKHSLMLRPRKHGGYGDYETWGVIDRL